MGWFQKEIYTKSNGYGQIDIDSEHFELGYRLYEAQKFLSNLEDKTKTIDFGEAVKICRYFTELVAWVGQLKADYRVMRECAEGKAVFKNE